MEVFNFQSFVLFLFYFMLGLYLPVVVHCLLCRIIDIACCIAMVLISLKVCLIVFSSLLNFSSKIFIEGMCVVALAHAVMTINGSTFHPLLVMLSMSGWYFLVFLVILCTENLSLHYVNSIN